MLNLKISEQTKKGMIILLQWQLSDRSLTYLGQELIKAQIKRVGDISHA